MQRCSKCGRTYEDNSQKFCTHDGGRLEPDNTPSSATAPTAYDLNQTIHTDPFDPEATVTRMPDLNKTIASLPTAEIRSKETGPTPPPPATPYQAPAPPPQQQSPQPPATIMFQQSQPQPPPPQQPPYYQPAPPSQTSGSLQQPHAQQQQQHYAPSGQLPQHQHGMQSSHAARKSSRLPLIIGLVVLLLVGGAAAWYFLIYKKGGESANSNSNVANQSANANESAGANANASASNNANTTVAEPPAPPNATRFTSSAENLDGKLAENFSNFSFYYPNTWERDPRAGVAGASNFIKVERRLPPDFTQENFAVSWYESKGTFELDAADVFPKLIESLKARYSKSFPEFEVLNEGETTINGIKGYEFRFQSVSRETEKGDITLWGRIVFLPPGTEGQKNGIQLLMLTTSLAPELASADDAGVKGELPMILNSFRVGINK
jgi:hypothetical protein